MVRLLGSDFHPTANDISLLSLRSTLLVADATATTVRCLFSGTIIIAVMHTTDRILFLFSEVVIVELMAKGERRQHATSG